MSRRNGEKQYRKIGQTFMQGRYYSLWLLLL